MKWIRFLIIASLLGAVSHSAALAQAPPSDPIFSPPDYDHRDDRDRDDRDRDDRNRGDRDRDERYDRDRHDHGDRDRYGDRRHRPRSPRREVGFFYDELLPYGDWVLTRQYGWAWFPADVHPSWRPYSEGRWVNSDYGWTWVTYEPFGWATYHYGRWAFDPRFGWLWVPGTIWGPAWVSWQNGGGYIGWAPLPPAVGFDIGIGIRLGNFDLSIGIQPDAYSFVPERSFLEARISGFLEPAARSRTIFRATRNVTNYSYVDSRVVNRGIAIRRIEQATGQRVRSLRIATDGRAKDRTEVARDELRIFRPERRQLDSVEVGPRADSGQRAEAPPSGRGGGNDRGREDRDREVPEFQVAPRENVPNGVDRQQIDRQQERARRDLERFQNDEKRRIEKAQQQELSRAKAQDDRAKVQQRHQEERQALQQAQQNAGQQLKERQKAKREALQPEAAPSAQDGPKADEPKKNDKKRDKKPKDDNGGGTP